MPQVAGADTETAAAPGLPEAVDLGTLPGGTGGGATAINDRGEIVGSSPVPGDPFASHAVIWR
jgi:hypothetical protein